MNNLNTIKAIADGFGKEINAESSCVSARQWTSEEGDTGKTVYFDGVAMDDFAFQSHVETEFGKLGWEIEVVL